MTAPAVTARSLKRDFVVGDRTLSVLDDLDLDVQRAEIIAIMGPSGSGKSTLLDLIGGLDTPTSGQLEVMGLDLAGLNQERLAAYRRDCVGFVFQSFELIPSMTACQNVALPLLLGGAGRVERQRESRRTLDRVGLGHRAGHLPAELSGGERQRVAIARALIRRPAILLADEPTGNLDSASGDEVLDLIGELNAERGQTIIMTTHDEQVAGRAHRVLHLRDGRFSDR